MSRIFRTLDGWVFRWVQPVGTSLTAFFSIFLSFNLEKVASKHPEWSGAFALLQGFNLYSIIVVCALAALVGTAYNFVRQRSVKRLHKEVRDLRDQLGAVVQNIPETLGVVLRGVGDQLPLNQTGGQRISLYVHKPSQNVFIPCGRFSYSPNLKRKGRTSFSDSKGCIGRAWEEDWHFMDNMPDPTSLSGYTDYMAKNYQMSREATRRLNMKPRMFAAKRIMIDADAIGVLVVESLYCEQFVEEELRQILEETTQPLARLLHGFLPHIADPNDPRRVGL
ncbi:hypothetical protein [Paracoccus sp. T5]|uniref:hypothetical protein n=1 Tax=Paracoccus sp. T5 TaxID=3402161 RepID=UPI003AED2AFD